MAALDNASFDAALKRFYTDKAVANTTYTNRPFLGMIPKKQDFSGKSYEVPITIGAIGGRSSDYASAVAAKSPSSHRRFTIKMARDYALADIDGLTIQSSMSDRGAFLKGVTSEIDGCLDQLSNNLANGLYRSGTGLRGVAGAPSGLDITLASPTDIHAFELGMTLEFVPSANGVTGALAVGNPKVLGVNRSTGTLTLDNVFAIAAGDFLFQLGDADNSGSRGIKVIGLDGWLPDPSTVTATPFNGVNRLDDITRLAGNFFDATVAGDNEEQALIKAGAQIFVEGGRPSHVFMHPTRVAALDRLLEQRGRYAKVQSTSADVGFDSIQVHTGGGVVDVMGDPWAPQDVGYMLQMDTWELVSIGSTPKLLSHDGNRLLRVGGADAVSVDTGYYANTSCNAPGRNGRIKFA